jgi:signal transduction histidine kinase
VILLATLFLSFWYYSSQKKAAAIAALRTKADAEKAALVIENAKTTAAQEREMMELMSHEVRNPLFAAMSASSFVAAAVLQDNPLASKSAVETCREDVHVIQSSLKFINDLLRSLLDMQKASSNALTLNLRPTDIRNDGKIQIYLICEQPCPKNDLIISFPVLEPVFTILASKHNPFDFRIECPDQIVVMTDHLRLKQVVMVRFFFG